MPKFLVTLDAQAHPVDGVPASLWIRTKLAVEIEAASIYQATKDLEGALTDAIRSHQAKRVTHEHVAAYLAAHGWEKVRVGSVDSHRWDEWRRHRQNCLSVGLLIPSTTVPSHALWTVVRQIAGIDDVPFADLERSLVQMAMPKGEGT